MSSNQWKVHFKSAPSEVYRALSTPLGRSRFWADSAKEADGVIHFVLPGDRTDDARIEESVKDHLYAVRYFGRLLTFTLTLDEHTHGTDLTLTCQPLTDTETGSRTGRQAATDHRPETGAGPDAAGSDAATWVSLLLRLKASVDFGVDLRNHDATRTTNYADGT